MDYRNYRIILYKFDGTIISYVTTFGFQPSLNLVIENLNLDGHEYNPSADKLEFYPDSLTPNWMKF